MNFCLLGYNGERTDPVSGTAHLGNGYRAYYPGLRRFNRPDSWSPFGHGGVNPYAYCAGDPVNQSDPSGHLSWQAGLGIALGALGILGAAFTAGTSLAAAASLSAALAASSLTALAVGTAGIVADVTGVASALTTHSNPKVSAILGWISFASGILSLGTGLAAGSYRMLNNTAMESGFSALATEDISELPATVSHTPTFEEVMHNKLIMRRTMRYLSGLDVDSLRATSTTMLDNVHNSLNKTENYSILIKRWENKYRIPVSLLEALKEQPTTTEALGEIRDIWKGARPFNPPSQLSLHQINPASARFMAINNFDKPYGKNIIFSALRWDNEFIEEVQGRNRTFRVWQSLFHTLHPDSFINA